MPTALQINCGKYQIYNEYNQLAKRIKITERLNFVTYDSPVNFNAAKNYSRHRWIQYKEGFSPSFVRDYFKRYVVNSKEGLILDPFAGVGTTVIEACLMGLGGVGLDVNPLAHFVSKTKALSLKNDQLNFLNNEILRFQRSKMLRIATLPDNNTVQSYFHQQYMEALLKVKAYYNSIEENSVRDLFKLAFLSLIETFSTHRKAGNGLKKKTRMSYPVFVGTPIEQVKEMMVERLSMFRDDLQKSPCVNNAKFIRGSCLELIEKESNLQFDAVLTSPPYMNCFDYSKIYMCELWLGDFFYGANCQREFRAASIRSHVHATWEERNEPYGSRIADELIYPYLNGKELWSNKIPETIRGYFRDIGKLFSLLEARVKKGAPIGFVVGNSTYGGITIATDLLIAEVAQRFSFECERIEIYRRIVPSSQQYKEAEDRDLFRESLVIMRKV